MVSSPWLLFVCSLPSSVLLYILRNYIPQLPIRSGRCMVLEESWMREKESQGVWHLRSRWVLSAVLTLSSLFLVGPSFWLAVSWSSQRPETAVSCLLLLWLPLQLSEHHCMLRSLCLRYKNGVVFLTDMLICTDTAHLLGLVWDDGYLIIADGEKVGRQEKASLLRWAHLPGIATTEWITPHANYFSFVTHYSYSLCDPG